MRPTTYYRLPTTHYARRIALIICFALIVYLATLGTIVVLMKLFAAPSARRPRPA